MTDERRFVTNLAPDGYDTVVRVIDRRTGRVSAARGIEAYRWAMNGLRALNSGPVAEIEEDRHGA